jgi:hypothetical protein
MRGLMTIYESLTAWLNNVLMELPEFDETIIYVEPNTENMGYLKEIQSPFDTHTSLMGHILHTEYKVFFIKKPFADIFDLPSNKRFLQGLENIILKRNMSPCP